MPRLIDAAANLLADIIVRITGRPEQKPREPRFDSPYAQLLARERS